MELVFRKPRVFRRWLTFYYPKRSDTKGIMEQATDSVFPITIHLKGDIGSPRLMPQVPGQPSDVDTTPAPHDSWNWDKL